VTLQSGLPWGIGDTTNDFSGTNEVNQPADGQEEQWNFYGNPKDFQPVHGFTQLNGDILAGGTGGIPYFSGTSNPTCAAKALALDGGKAGLATAALANTGCYAMGSSILIPPAFGTYGTSGRDIFRDGGFRNWDLSIFKTFKFKADRKGPYTGGRGGNFKADPEKLEVEREKSDKGPGYHVLKMSAAQNGDTPALGTGDYITGQKPPIEARRIYASTAWNCAARMAQADLGYEAAKNIADKIFLDLLKKGKAIEDEDIPF